ncbi:H-NS family nucleoid-associated regulatory protein [Paraburkholderia humisilvae]|uniref:DNA-binding protein H-NS-like C-terminal domain-containing protein n=1 Tax=Paraburkholderia humisilvae TaxID=627669 RepID=A0A6J5DCN1_9BURK|nr:H-NS family nucleoid-associated regulatory protein [Paraburkholderia humisilvae]CAB3750922.1 hypothetical protein LMG29542_01369 [Paraburkholderia humisilvae]
MNKRIADGEARDRLIIWIRRRMEEFGITIDALAASIEHDRRHPPLYRDARGNEWNGQGPMPGWLQAAKHAGVDPDFFRIAAKPAAQDAGTQEATAASRQMDLFT